MRNLFIPVSSAVDLIQAGHVMVVAGVEAVLASLPRGRWIGGTTPYFMTPSGGQESETHVFCTVLDEVLDARIRVLSPDELASISDGRFDSGFSYLLLPAFSAAHRRFALEAPDFPGQYGQPMMGWVTGVRVSEIGAVAPKVCDGTTGRLHDASAVVLYCRLAADLEPDLDIVNLFTQGDGPTIVFPETGLDATVCRVDGRDVNLARWLTGQQVDTRLPLVADYAGAMINVSIQRVDAEQGVVSFYAPVVAGEQYRIARSVADYGHAYTNGLGDSTDAGSTLSCNCVLNYLYAGLEGKTTSGFVGPVTFGEVAYILLNQTLVRLQLRTRVGAGEPA